MSQNKKTDDITNLVNRVDRENSGELHVEAIGLKEVLGKLNEEQRFVIDLLYLKGYTQSEVSEEFNIPLGTVKTRTRMALGELRSILQVK